HVRSSGCRRYSGQPTDAEIPADHRRTRNGAGLAGPVGLAGNAIMVCIEPGRIARLALIERRGAGLDRLAAIGERAVRRHERDVMGVLRSPIKRCAESADEKDRSERRAAKQPAAEAEARPRTAVNAPKLAPGPLHPELPTRRHA